MPRGKSGGGRVFLDQPAVAAELMFYVMHPGTLSGCHVKL
jgi:hypothetical protein